MASEKKGASQGSSVGEEHGTVETGVERDQTFSLDMGNDDARVSRDDERVSGYDTATGELDADELAELEALRDDEGGEEVTEGEQGEEGEADEGEAADDGDAGDDTGAGGDEGEGEAEEDGGDAEPEAAPAADLGEYKPDDKEVSAAFDARYHKEDGTLNMDALSREWWQNSKGTDDGTLNAGTYDYLLKKHGLEKSVVEQVESAIKVQTVTTRTKVLDGAGGQELVNAAAEWGKKGGYTKEQRGAFNKAMRSTDPGTVQDALELAVSRFRKANPDWKPATAAKGEAVTEQAAKGGAAAGAKKKPKDATAGGAASAGGGGGEGYPSRDEWRKEFRAANKAGDERKLGEIRRKLARSDWYKTEQKKGKRKP